MSILTRDELAKLIVSPLNNLNSTYGDHARALAVADAILLKYHVMSKAAALAYEIERDHFRAQIVWGFYEGRWPHYTQGPSGEHELTSPITANEANELVNSLQTAEAERDSLRERVAALEAGFALRAASRTRPPAGAGPACLASPPVAPASP